MRKAILALAASATAVVGAAGYSLIQEHEGLRTKTYLDPVGIPTVCYGHTGRFARTGASYTPDECEAILKEDIAVHRRGLEKCVTYDLNQNQWDAVTSFAFNVGVGRACKSTLVRKINAGDLDGAAAEFPKWKYAGGRVFKGLVRRRADEAALFFEPVTCECRDVKVTYSHLNR